MGRLTQAVVNGVTSTYQYNSFGNLVMGTVNGTARATPVDPSTDATQEHNRFAPATSIAEADSRSDPMKFTGHERDRLVTLSAAALSAREYYDGDSVTAGRTYAYRLKNGSDLFSNADVASTVAFTPAAVGALTTATAFNSALAAVNSVRAAVGWPAVTWTDILSSKDPLPAPGARIVSTQVMAARARMNEALQALGVNAAAYTPGDVKGFAIEAHHLNDITERAY